MIDGRTDHERIPSRITIPSDTTVLDRNATHQDPIPMKGPSLTEQFGDDKTSSDDQITEAIIEAISANDKVIEIRPAERSKGMGMKGFLLLGAIAVAVAYWVQSSQRPDDLIDNVREKTADQINQSAETIEDGSEAASKRIERGSERVGDAVQEAGEKAADRTEEAGDKAADRTEEAGDKADDDTDSGVSSSSRM